MLLSVAYPLEELTQETRKLEETLGISPMEEVEVTQKTRTLEKNIVMLEENLEIPSMEETPVSEITGIENPSSNSPQFDHARNLKTLEIPPVEEVEVAQKTRALEKNTVMEEETLENPTMEETSLAEITGIDNPSSDSPRFDHAQNLKTLEILSMEEVEVVQKTRTLLEQITAMEEVKAVEIPSMEEDIVTMEETTGILSMEEVKTLEEEFTQGDGKIEDALILQTLKKSTRGEGNIDDSLNFKTLEKSSGIEIEDACTSEDTDICLDDLQNSLELGSGDDDDDDDDDDSRERKEFLLYPSQRIHRPKRCHCGSPFCDQRRYRGLHHPSSNLQTCDYGDPHSENRNRFWMNRNPVFMDRNPMFMTRYDNDDDDDNNNNPFTVRSFPLEFLRGKPDDSPSRFQRWKNEPKRCPVGAGLANMGNTCFLNSIMQCFTHTVPFVQGLQSLKHESSSHGENEFCVLCAVRKQIEYSIGDSGKVIMPSNLVNNLNHFSSSFRRYQQEDAQEFLHCLVDKLESSWSNYEANAWDSPSSSDDNLVKQVFGGRLVSQVRCTECGHISDSYEPVIDLSLEIEDVGNLENALKSFTKVESIEDFRCQGCEKKVQVEKQLKLDKTPSVASFHLKRFKSDGVYVEKIDKMVAYPLELDLDPYSKHNEDVNEELKYELFAVVVHEGGSYSSGHYLSYIRSAPGAWYRFDDSDVCRVTEERALDQAAYILFYARKGTPWFATLIRRPKTTSADSSPKSVLDQTTHPSPSVQQSPENVLPSDVCSPSSSEPRPPHDDVSMINKGGAGTSYLHHLPRVQEKLSPSSSSSPLSFKKSKAVKYVKSKSKAKSKRGGRRGSRSENRRKRRHISFLHARKRIRINHK